MPAGLGRRDRVDVQALVQAQAQGRAGLEHVQADRVLGLDEVGARIEPDPQVVMDDVQAARVVLAVARLAAALRIEADLTPLLAVEQADRLRLRRAHREGQRPVVAGLEGDRRVAQRRQQPPRGAGQAAVEDERAQRLVAVEALGDGDALAAAGIGLEPRGGEDAVEIRGVDAHEGHLHPVLQLGLASELPELFALGLRPRPEAHERVPHEEQRGRPYGGGRGEDRAALHLEEEVVEAQREAGGLIAVGVEREVDEAVDDADVLTARDHPSRAAAFQREQPLFDPSPRLGDAEGLGADLDAGRRRRAGDGLGTLQLEVALLGGEALEDERALFLPRRRRGERPQIEVRGRVLRAPRLVEPVEHVVGGRGRIRAGGGRAGGDEAHRHQRRRACRRREVHARARVAGVAGGLRGRRTANTLPWPGRLLTSTDPLCRRTISRTR